MDTGAAAPVTAMSFQLSTPSLTPNASQSKPSARLTSTRRCSFRMDVPHIAGLLQCVSAGKAGILKHAKPRNPQGLQWTNGSLFNVTLGDWNDRFTQPCGTRLVI